MLYLCYLLKTMHHRIISKPGAKIMHYDSEDTKISGKNNIPITRDKIDTCWRGLGVQIGGQADSDSRRALFTGLAPEVPTPPSPRLPPFLLWPRPPVPAPWSKPPGPLFSLPLARFAAVGLSSFATTFAVGTMRRPAQERIVGTAGGSVPSLPDDADLEGKEPGVGVAFESGEDVLPDVSPVAGSVSEGVDNGEDA
jgi:hypothetical protein